MTIGIPCEIKNNEKRVAVTPAMVQLLVSHGHRVVIQRGAGEGAFINDEDYTRQGAVIASSAEEVWGQHLVVKVKEPLESEYPHFREGLLLFCYLHLAAEEQLTRALCASGVTAIAYETVREAGQLPLLRPMSEVAGRRAPVIAATLMEHYHGGRGILLGGVPGVERAKVLIIGGGVAGTNAARIAMGLGAEVVVAELSENRLRELEATFGAGLLTIKSNPYNVAHHVADADVVISGVLVQGARAPQVVTEDMVKSMKSSSVIIDIAVDQGGSVATIDRTTTHDHPTYIVHGVLHYAVPNMPGATPQTSTYALANATAPYVVELANHYPHTDTLTWWQGGVNIENGKVTHPVVASCYSDLDFVQN